MKKALEQLSIANREIDLQNDEKNKRAAELLIANKELLYQINEKEKRAAELAIANKELLFQNNEKEKRAAELIIANKELAYQNKEKEDRAAELIIANNELAYQNEEKEKRAAELIIANTELAFQNDQKEARAQELIIANKELKFQNSEKVKRAKELAIANKELAYQNIQKEKRKAEKEKRAADLVVANRELAYQEKRSAELLAANKELALANSELKKAQGELESFSYSVSHDLRAPIRAINGYTRILLEDYSEKFDADGLKVLDSVILSSKKMGQLIDDLLAFSKLGRKHVALANIDMAALVNAVIDEIVIDDGQNIPQFTIHSIPKAKGDPSLIKQVWINLISNAVKYSRNKSVTNIEIGGTVKANKIVYYVKDFGAGFDMEYYDKLFGVFQRLHSQDEFDGTGIGLAIVQKIVDRHHGTVWAESALNHGACFYFSLPTNNNLK